MPGLHLLPPPACQGLLTNKTPFEIRAKGQNFWSHLSSSERHAMTFDAAMQQVRQQQMNEAAPAERPHMHEARKRLLRGRTCMRRTHTCCCDPPAALQKHHIGGSAAAAAYPFRSFDTLIDVAGGVGTFTAAVLGSHPGVHGIVLDQQQQISRAQQVRG